MTRHQPFSPKGFPHEQDSETSHLLSAIIIVARFPSKVWFSDVLKPYGLITIDQIPPKKLVEISQMMDMKEGRTRRKVSTKPEEIMLVNGG